MEADYRGKVGIKQGEFENSKKQY